MKALIVDDSRAMRRILRGIMENMGFEITEAENGLDAKEKLAVDSEFEVALVDWNMPVMNGLDFIKFVRGESCYTKIKLVMVTTETEPEQMVRALMSGVDEFVMKPFTPDMLIEKLRIIGVRATTETF